MHLPERYQNEWSIDHDKDALDIGDNVYFAPDGTMHVVTDIEGETVELNDLDDMEFWEVEKDGKDGMENLLYSDFFPIERK